jgi:Single-strand binding protein family
VVLGRLRTRVWETQEGEKRTSTEIDADEVAPSLRWAIATPGRADRTRDADLAPSAAAAPSAARASSTTLRRSSEATVKIRLEGTRQECEQAAPRLAEVFDVVSVSDPYPNRGRSLLVRVYVEVRLSSKPDVDHDDAAAPPRVTIHRPGRELPTR